MIRFISGWFGLVDARWLVLLVIHGRSRTNGIRPTCEYVRDWTR